jgi:hypothetical protein
MATDHTPKNSSNFYCDICDFVTCKKNDFLRHEQTQKHIRNNLATIQQHLATEKTLSCEFCNKTYKDRTGLWRHKKLCNADDNNVLTDEPPQINEIDELKGFMNYLMKENSEMKGMMMEVIKNGTTQNSHNNTTNSHNKAFNLNFFLNETCKDAMNITEFVESIKLQLSDLEKVGELGYVEGISNIIVKNLKNLDVTQRPVHCTDKKRETMYIKDEDTWEKDEEQKKMHKLVRKVADKNARMLPKFKEAHPDCTKSASRYSDQYNKIIMEAMGGRGDDDFEKEEKIIKKVSKEVIIRESHKNDLL